MARARAYCSDASRDVDEPLIATASRIDHWLLVEYRAWAGAESPSLNAPGGGESRADAAARYARGLAILLDRPEDTALVIGHALCVRYVLDAVDGHVPAALMLSPVEHAVPHRLDAEDLRRAAELLEDWSRAPAFRDPAAEGRGRS